MERRKTAINLVSLTSIQLLNYLLPLVTMPYLIHTIGIQQYGRLSFAQAVMQYFILITDYGFTILGTQKIALYRQDKEKRDQLFSEILWTKLFLLVLSFFLLIGMLCVIPKMRQQPLLYMLLFGIVVGNVFFPVWFFQGIEEMKYIGILNFVGKFSFMVGLFLFVHDTNDLYLAGFFNAFSYLVVGCLSFFFVRFHYHVPIKKVAFSTIISHLKEAWHLFVAAISTSFYTTTNLFFLGLVASDSQMGYFNLANTLIRACASIAVPLTQTFFPKVARLVKQKPEKALQWIKQLAKVYAVLFTTGCFILLFFSRSLLTVLFNEQFIHAIPLIQIMSFLPLMVAFGNIFGILMLSLFGYQKELSHIYFYGGICSLCLMVPLTLRFLAIGAAVTAVLTETLVTIMMGYVVWKKEIVHYKKKGLHYD